MRITFFLPIILLLYCHSVAQNYSNIHWGSATPVGGSPSACLVNDTLFTFSNMQNNGRHINYRSFDRNGQLLDSNGFVWDTTVFGIWLQKTGLQQLPDGRLLSLHDITYQNATSFTQLIKFNKNLDTLKSRFFNPGIGSIFYSFDLLIEDTAITVLGHYALPNQKINLFLARYDTALNLQWYSTIADFRPNVPNYYNGYYPYRLRRMGNNYYIAGRCLYPNQFVEGFLVKTDLQGNKIWDKRYKYNGNNGVDADIVPLGNDSLFVAHFYLSSQQGTFAFGKTVFRIVDTAGVVIKETPYPEEEAFFTLQNAEMFDDAILLTGHFYQGGAKGLIWKLDKNLNTLWRRVYYYGDWEDESYLYSINQWSDGGLVGVGTYYDRYLNPNWEALFLWLLSTDSTGCIGPGNCGSDIGFVEWALPGQGIKVYPNPATDYINIELSLPGLQNTTATATLYNLAGQEVLRQEVQFENGQAKLDLTAQVSSAIGGKGWSGLLQLKTPTHVFVEKIVVQ